MSWVWAAIGILVLPLFGAAVGDLFSQEIRTRLDQLPHGIIRLAGRRLSTQVRTERLEEWRGELHEILRGADAMPITRLWRGLRFSIGLFRAAPAISRAAVQRVDPLRPSDAWVFRPWARPAAGLLGKVLRASIARQGNDRQGLAGVAGWFVRRFERAASAAAERGATSVRHPMVFSHLMLAYVDAAGRHGFEFVRFDAVKSGWGAMTCYRPPSCQKCANELYGSLLVGHPATE